MRDIKRRVRAVSNIRQITRAMELVASTKMRRARELLNKTRPYSQTIEDVIDDIITYIREDERYKEEGEKYKHFPQAAYRCYYPDAHYFDCFEGHHDCCCHFYYLYCCLYYYLYDLYRYLHCFSLYCFFQRKHPHL